MARLFLSIALWIAALAVGAGLAGFLWLRSSLPQTEGSVTLTGLTAPVEVMRDEHGVPHIFAANPKDAYFALGYVHAQDRLWQMEQMRRAGAGRLSEVLGARALPQDRFLRTLGVYRLAEAQAETLSGDLAVVLDAYVAGVNAYIDGHEGAWPIEFILLRHTPDRWRRADSLVWARLMGLQLSTGWHGDLLRGRMLPVVGPQRLRALFPIDPGGAPTTVSDDVRPALERIAGLAGLLSADSASNAWVLSGARTASGKPILANDPHLGFEAPGLWYLARLVTPEREITGATVPGVPLTILGHNGRLAWGMTTPGADTSDLFVESPAAADAGRYLTPTGPEPFAVRRELIRVRDAEPVEQFIRATRHGPVISEVVPAAGKIAAGNRVVALAETALLSDDRTVEALRRINRASTVEAFEAAAALFAAPLQNLFAADTDGAIGYVTAGRMPIRRAGNGHLPVPGLHGHFDWTGFVPTRDWPRLRNPESGLIANANNRISTLERPYSYAWYWPESHRAARILEVLGDAEGHGVEDSIALQMDIVSPAARRLAPLLTGIEPRSKAARAALELVRRWDYRMDRNRPEPLIYAAWTRHLTATLMADELGGIFKAYNRPRPRVLIGILTQDRDWCDDVGTPETESCEARIALALERAIDELAARHGPDPGKWRWGDAHRAAFNHRILTHIPVLRAVADGTIPTDGGDHTLNRGQTGGAEDNPYRHTHGAGYRAVYDLGDLAASRYLIATGQSGNPLSPRYMEFLPRWRDGRYIRIAGSPATLRARGAAILTLRPRPR